MPYKDKAKILQYQKEYRLRNTCKAKIYLKDWNIINQEHCRSYRVLQRETYRNAWHQWFIENGYTIPTDKTHYHHQDPYSKIFEVGQWIAHHPVTPENIKTLKMELSKCIDMDGGQHVTIHNLLRRNRLDANAMKVIV